MPTTDYYTADGTRVPGTTTVIGRFKESGGLIHWAWQKGKEGRDYKDMRDDAATAGTYCHSWIEAFAVKGEEPAADAADPLQAKALQGFESFREWWDLHQFTPVETEMHLVSEIYRYGGTPDLVAIDKNNRLCLLDWKCSNKVYQDYLIQLAAYKQLWNERRKQQLERFHLLRVGKEAASFEHRMWAAEDLDLGFKMFSHLREAYDIDKQLKKVAAC